MTVVPQMTYWPPQHNALDQGFGGYDPRAQAALSPYYGQTTYPPVMPLQQAAWQPAPVSAGQSELEKRVEILEAEKTDLVLKYAALQLDVVKLTKRIEALE